MARDREQFDRLVSATRAEAPLSERKAGEEPDHPSYAAHLVLDGHEYLLTITPTLLEDENNRGEPLDG